MATTTKKVTNQATIDTQTAAKAAAKTTLATAQSTLATAKGTAQTKAGASVLPTTGTPTATDLSSARYTAMAAALNALGTQSTLNVSYQTKAEQAAVETAQANYEAINIPAPTYEDVNTTSLEVLKASLLAQGYPASIVDKSATYLQQLLQEGLDADAATNIFLTMKSYTLKDGTTISSPFYEEYGKYNEGLTVPKTPSELFNAVEGYRAAKNTYNLADKFVSEEYIKQYIKNGMDVATFNQQATTAQLMALTSDPFQVDALKQMGYIASASDLTDFYLDPTVGKNKMQQNLGTAAYLTETLRRVTPENLTTGDLAYAQRVGASMAARGLSTAEMTTVAAQGAQNIAEQTPFMALASGMYEQGNKLTTEESKLRTKSITEELQNQELTGLASERRKRFMEQYTRSLQGSAGTTRYSLSQTGTSGLI